ncbi:MULTISPECIES: FKBP-type peptidyl-prolyl cis-trans isomerase [Streptomyces]|uniref:FKBP-type peptidyl-prolyl cis-trans isomerase n=1 Tax=Streptomyces TaxID=1883 RepID=UPI00017E91FA|nr:MULTISPECIES: FKBP-type peptidyl-prolyl cis-trans isomerase [Streptomyces]AKL65433.1 peptidylprolyl isomerase [Streptomyces sp. Mg1]EDX24889.1 FK506-binding protein 10 [Streptomyces sp. Mg1]WBY19419.1 FKBP-type peptidyl-prolyl cis-trans isomerase [Streptomyces goshikiensis]WSR98201.1 FKBP-type peptidyl-prolyl cis-trans isomerase [Streptomyces goshikiensis]WSY00762.1 FKBP-type peptidyl-prolyl cis-trans isomerase [Streptomyces goshikiensis]
MRRRLAAALIVPALMLTAACGGGDDSGKKKDASPSASPSQPDVPKAVASADPMPTVKGEVGQKAEITAPKGEPSGKFVVNTLKEGTGPEVKKDDLVVTKYTGKIWKDGKELAGSYDKDGSPLVVPAGSPTIVPMFSEAVLGKKIGSRVLVVAPPAAAFGAQGQPQLGVGPTDNLIFVLDVDSVMPKKAEGTQAPIPSELPQVKADKDEAATITVPKNDPPKELVDKVLIEGKGPEVKNGQTVYMQYSGAAWAPNQGKDAAKLFDTSWKTGAPFSTKIGEGQVIEGWDKGLVGKKVGSRVLLVIPPGQAYKDQAKGEDLPANSTLVFVVDIVGAV